jgi:hypothetical protein
MSLTLKKGAVTSTTQYTTSNGDFKYSVSVQKNGTTIQSINGSITKDTTQVGNFNKYQNNQEALNFNTSLTIAEKQAILADIGDIIGQLFA